SAAQPNWIGGAMTSARNDKHARQHQDDAAQREPRRALAKEEHRARGGEERAGAARERIDEREITDVVPALQDEVVGEVNEPGAEHEPPAQGADVRTLPEPQANDSGRVNDKARSREQPGYGGASANALGQQIPRRVDKRRRENQKECEWRHR